MMTDILFAINVNGGNPLYCIERKTTFECYSVKFQAIEIREI